MDNSPFQRGEGQHKIEIRSRGNFFSKGEQQGGKFSARSKWPLLPAHIYIHACACASGHTHTRTLTSCLYKLVVQLEGDDRVRKVSEEELQRSCKHVVIPP